MSAGRVPVGRVDVGAGAARAGGGGAGLLPPPRDGLPRHLPGHARAQG